MSEPKLSPLARLVVAGAKAAYGDRWQSPLQRATKLPLSTLQKITSTNDQRDVTPVTAKAVALALISEADRLEAASEKVREAGTRILNKLDGK